MANQEEPKMQAALCAEALVLARSAIEKGRAVCITVPGVLSVEVAETRQAAVYDTGHGAGGIAAVGATGHGATGRSGS